jgi:hypothetical protein
MTIAEMSMEELISSGRIVGQSENAILVERTVELASANPSYTELGHSGMTAYGSMARYEYNNDLRGQLGLRIYDKMRRNDSQVKTSLNLVKTPVYSATWYMDPASPNKRDVKIAAELWKNLTKQLSVSFTTLLLEALSCIDFGWYAFEPVYQRYEGKVLFKKFAPRHPLDCVEWHYAGSDGGPVGCSFQAGDDPAPKFIPMKSLNGQTRLIVFTMDKEGGDMQGISRLRPAYKNWYYKENLLRVDAIQKERHGIGIPVVTLPAGAPPADKAAANELGRNIRTNEKAHITLPPLWEIHMLKMEGQMVDVLKSVEYHDRMIARNVIAPFAFSEQGTTSAETQELFLKGARFIADIIRDVFNKWAIPDWVRFNYGPNVELPELKVRRIGDTVDWRTISFALRNLIGANIIQPDDGLEVYMRNEMDLPALDPATIREVQKPQVPGQASKGTPKQKPAGEMNKGTGSAGAGKDGGSPGK